LYLGAEWWQQRRGGGGGHLVQHLPARCGLLALYR
jgi:hypothetical protein